MSKIWRPKKYDIKDYTKLFNEYMRKCWNEYLKFIKSQKINEKWTKVYYDYALKVTLPTIGGFANYCGINRDTIYDWCKKYPDFSDIIEIIKCYQAEMLIAGWLAQIYNAPVTKILLIRLLKSHQRFYQNNEFDLSDFFKNKKKDVLVSGGGNIIFPL